MTPTGVGTTAHIVGRFLKGMMVEQIEREFTEVEVDERIVSRGRSGSRTPARGVVGDRSAGIAAGAAAPPLTAAPPDPWSALLRTPAACRPHHPQPTPTTPEAVHLWATTGQDTHPVPTGTQQVIAPTALLDGVTRVRSRVRSTLGCPGNEGWYRGVDGAV